MVRNEKIKYQISLVRICIYLVGLSCTCFGVAIMLESEMGLDAWNAVFAGLEKLTPLSLGMWSIIIQGSFLVIASVLDQRVELFCIFPIVWKGIVLDLSKAAIAYIQFGNTFWSRVLLFLGGYAIVGIATGVYVATGYPKMPIDGLMMAVSRFFSWEVKKSRLLIEVSGFIVMFLVGGPFGSGTIIITFTFGYVVSATQNFAENKILKNLKLE
ncbi:YczE/YyaS/YitT family protein [Clostridium tyrobutyricum]|uniref:YczE/YyaS/YitT family protein n=1 Tax=Clostridium tyrobutyricum TaxID=1519 RepID=UPI00057EE205|nr:hypothetical protein [Clostridium tyrobutyricum]